VDASGLGARLVTAPPGGKQGEGEKTVRLLKRFHAADIANSRGARPPTGKTNIEHRGPKRQKQPTVLAEKDNTCNVAERKEKDQTIVLGLLD